MTLKQDVAELTQKWFSQDKTLASVTISFETEAELGRGVEVHDNLVITAFRGEKTPLSKEDATELAMELLSEPHPELQQQNKNQEDE